MKKRPSKKAVVQKSKAAPSTPPESVPPVVANPSPVKVVYGPPPPEILLQEAYDEPDYRDLANYGETISVLKSKGFSFREIAKWLVERDVNADHNAVYRVYTKGVSDAELADIERQDEEDER